MVLKQRKIYQRFNDSFNDSQLTEMKKSIPDMSLPSWTL